MFLGWAARLVIDDATRQHQVDSAKQWRIRNLNREFLSFPRSGRRRSWGFSLNRTCFVIVWLW
jgi:hypothetical protein